MKNALITTPLAVAIQADQFCFQHYTSGVFTNTACGTNLDHATNVVGWGTESRHGLLAHEKLLGHLLGRVWLHQDRDCVRRWSLRYPNGTPLPHR